VSRYEALSLALVDMTGESGAVLPTFPARESPLRIEQFFKSLYLSTMSGTSTAHQT
jgi:hypothetical protein